MPEEREVSVLVGGRAGDGINNAGALVARLLSRLGYRIYLYFDYPSLIRGGHNFAVVRAASRDVGTCREKVDFVLALNQETLTRHRGMFHEGTAVLFNADVVKSEGQGIPVRQILAAEQAPEIMGNSVMIGGFAKAAGIPWDLVEDVFRAVLPKGTDLNLKVARRAYDQLAVARAIPERGDPPLPLLTGNEAIGLGLIRGGLDAYISYPMTPSSSLLHFLAGEKEKFGITVVHPENEIAVVLMALGFAYAGKRAAVGTSGGGFCLMTEGLSLAGMAELPLVFVVSQRTGPSTGLPTYTGQSELAFVLHAGQGEFPRLIVAPGDAGEALAWSAIAQEISWQFQVPVFVLPDKTLSEGTYSIDTAALPSREDGLAVPGRAASASLPYRRYADTPDGVSPPAFPGTPGAVVKVNSYAHDESGYTTEEGDMVSLMTEKRLRKQEALARAMNTFPQVNVLGKPDAPVALLCWGSTKGVCAEVGETLGLRVVQPVVLEPFPVTQLRVALSGATTLICVEENATGQLAAIASEYGIIVDKEILRYDGRPFTYESLLEKVREVVS
ncbi:2-oxoacid:acceptor oxidoreductase subunit alpha [Methanoregula sp.]|uniref:2-oxoacid:acceptor oxidoreductase subunit alpha n=1 Tax=Methanoregula sp. TaxID=2052170 RepID=UPI0026239246|nr:2-oxoacid:acceptor oxidoreductase subunit alpha [Methanoregula sp.]MDD5143422.1 2-oxoacid:acceptor oxidoreductase subunit alpha [Methanoregula sp.]